MEALRAAVALPQSVLDCFTGVPKGNEYFGRNGSDSVRGTGALTLKQAVT